jgi:hypothetical protein
MLSLIRSGSDSTKAHTATAGATHSSTVSSRICGEASSQ